MNLFVMAYFLIKTLENSNGVALSIKNHAIIIIMYLALSVSAHNFQCSRCKMFHQFVDKDTYQYHNYRQQEIYYYHTPTIVYQRSSM